MSKIEEDTDNLQAPKPSPRSLGTTSNGGDDPPHQRLAGAHTTQSTTRLTMTRLMSLDATQDHEPEIPDTKQYSGSQVAQWLQDQKRDNRVPYLGVM
ncbi:hypothetical protein MMC22_006114 [Lobaria immixta]|nr:hypothetical protein [Lobaria immixta]